MTLDLTAIMRREGIRKIELYDALDRFSVVLADGSLGTGATVGEALDNAHAPNAENVRRAA